MANALIEESTMTAIADAIRAKTGKTDLILPTDMATEIAGITGSDSDRTVLIEEQEHLMVLYNDFAKYGCSFDPIPFVPVVGENYLVVWEGTEYECTAQDATLGTYSGVGFGNGGVLGVTEVTGEPFYFVYVSNANMFVCFSASDTEQVNRTVAVYQEAADTSDLVKYVTFMNWDGSKELYKKPTISGDDCVDVVAKGLTDKPIRESSETTNYDYNGWSLTAGGSADSTALQNVTEDRIVYAAFTESVRYYTVNFYTEVGVLHETVQVTYGGTATPSENPTKYGYSFESWTPSNANITADTDCYAVWVEAITFAGGSWADIARISEAGEASKYFSIGDKRTISFGESELELIITGFDHDNLSDGSGKAGISIACNTLPSDITKSYGSYIYANTNNGLRTYLNGTVKEMLPSDLQAVLKEISKPCDSGYASSNTETLDVSGYLFPLSFKEINKQPSSDKYLVLGETYEAFSSGLASYNAYIHGTTSYGEYLTRQLYHVGTLSPASIKPTATNGYTYGVTTATYIRFCFCI